MSKQAPSLIVEEFRTAAEPKLGKFRRGLNDFALDFVGDYEVLPTNEPHGIPFYASSGTFVT